jgi:hypothetical protein
LLPEKSRGSSPSLLLKNRAGFRQDETYNCAETKLDFSINIGIIRMNRFDRAIERMKHRPQNVRFEELRLICENYFGPPRQKGTSHRIYQTGIPENPRINIQNDRGKAKAYQVRQLIAVIEQLENDNGHEE